MSVSKKILSCFLCIASIFLVCISPIALATDYSSEGLANWWDFYMRTVALKASGDSDLQLISRLLSSEFSGEVCSVSDDGWHHSDTVLTENTENGHATARCLHCGEIFKLDTSQLQTAYDTYVNGIQEDLGTTTVTEGGYRVYLKYVSDGGYNGGSDNSWIELIRSPKGSVGFSQSGYWSNSLPNTVLYFPRFDGLTLTHSAHVTGGFDLHSVGMPVCATNSSTMNGGTDLVEAGTSIRYVEFYLGYQGADNKPASGTPMNVILSPYYDIVPLEGIPSLTDKDTTVNSRPTAIAGDYGIIGDDGTIIKYDSTKIVDETNSLVWNPVTDTSVNFTEWSYDYSDRSYNLTLEDGSTMKVVYGDENVTIEQGDTIYNVYYMLPDSGSGDGSGGSGGAGDDGSGGIGGAISGLFDVLGEIIYGLIEGAINLATKALEALSGLGDLFTQMVETVLGFFGGFIDFLSAMFPFLPEETFTIINLGLILMIAAAVFRKFLK